MPKLKEVTWYSSAADLMVKKNIGIYQAAVLLNQMMTKDEAEAHFASDAFQRVLRNSRNKWYTEQANDPGHNRRSLVGKLLIAAEALTAEGKHDKAAEVYHKIAKIEGWEKGGENITIIGDLTQKDLDDIKAKLSDTYPDIKGTARA